MAETDLRSIIEKCRVEAQVDRKIEFLHQINDCLPSAIRVRMPSFLTDDFVNSALDSIEERLSERQDCL